MIKESSSFKDGNIMSLTLHNFQTVKNITFTFLPGVKFIIGPNGSGKSTVSNAISFIIGGNPKTIGKAKQLKDYIRFGEEKCKIEASIWYKGKINVLSRSFTHTVNTFIIDGVAVKKNVYDEFIRSLKININNLCQYLPQERVSEFVRMSPEELLVQTCISLEKQEVITDFNTTKELEQLLDDVNTKETLISQEKNNVKTFVDAVYKDVEKIKEREGKKARIEMMEMKKIWINYENMKTDYKRLINSLKMMNKSYKDTLVETEGLRVEIESIKRSPLNKEMVEKIKGLGDWDDKISKLIEDLRQQKSRQIHLEVDLEHLDKKKDKTHEEVKVLENEKEKVKESLKKERLFIKEKLLINNLLKINTTEHVGCKKKKIEDDKIVLERFMELFNDYKEVNVSNYLKVYNMEKIEEKEERLYELKRKKNEIQDLCILKKTKFDELEEKKKKINEEGERRLELLKRYNLDTYKDVIWYRENKSLFNNEIVEPAFLQINILNEKFTAEIEIFLSFTLMTSFICKDSRDFSLFMKKTKDELKLKINAIEQIKEVVKSEYSQEKIRELGFEGILNDFIDVRAETRDFLITHGHFDSIPITKTCLDEKKVFEETNIKRLAMDSKYYEIRRSRYNKKDFVVFSSAITPKNLFSKKIDTSEIEVELKELSLAREKYSSELKTIYTEIDVIEKALKGLIQEKSTFDKEVNVLTTHVNMYNMNLHTLKQKETIIKDLKDETKFLLKKSQIEMQMEEGKQTINDLKNSLIAILRDPSYLDLFRECMLVFKDIRSEFKKLDFLQNYLEMVTKNKLALSVQIEEHEKTKAKLKDALNENKNKLQMANQQFEGIQGTMSMDTLPSQMPINEQMKALPNTIDELNLEIVKEKTQLKFYNVNEDAKLEYEAKRDHLNKLSEYLLDILKNKKVYEEMVRKNKSKLIKTIKSLIELINLQFKDLFSKIGCEGKCEFFYSNGHETVPCKNWKLNIYVKFRENEKLEILSYFRQSGGEKSVATILFLLALQKSDKAPFRLVD